MASERVQQVLDWVDVTIKVTTVVLTAACSFFWGEIKELRTNNSAIVANVSEKSRDIAVLQATAASTEKRLDSIERKVDQILDEMRKR